MQGHSRRSYATSERGRRARLVAALAAAVPALFGIGYFFHTSPEPVFAGKYNLRYTLFLMGWYFVLVPGVYLLTRFLGTVHRFHLPSGRVLPWRPWQKIRLAFILALLGIIAGDYGLGTYLRSRSLTHSADMLHPYLQNAHRPGDEAWHINRWGFRGEEIEKDKPADTFRVFVFGGSTVFCGTVPFEKSHCRILERELQRMYPQQRIEVQNLGAEWHTSQHSVMKLLFQAAEFEPDLVVIWHAINDMCQSLTPNAFSEGAFRRDYGHYYGALSKVRRPWRIALFLADSTRGHWFADYRMQTVQLLGPEGDGLKGSLVLLFPKAKPVDVTWHSLDSFERNLRDFVEIAQRKQMVVVVAAQPNLYRPDLTVEERKPLIFAASQQMEGGRMASFDSMLQGFRTFNAAAARIARECGAHFMDLEREVPKTLEYLYDDVHYTLKGNERVGKALAEFIRARRFIEQ